MDEIPGGVDIAAMFIALDECDCAPLTRMAPQKLVSLPQSLYGYTKGHKLFNDSVLAFEYSLWRKKYVAPTRVVVIE